MKIKKKTLERVVKFGADYSRKTSDLFPAKFFYDLLTNMLPRNLSFKLQFLKIVKSRNFFKFLLIRFHFDLYVLNSVGE